MSGATAIEYGLIAAGISIAIIAAVVGLGTQLTNTFDTVSGDLATTANDVGVRGERSAALLTDHQVRYLMLGSSAAT